MLPVAVLVCAFCCPLNFTYRLNIGANKLCMVFCLPPATHTDSNLQNRQKGNSGDACKKPR